MISPTVYCMWRHRKTGQVEGPDFQPLDWSSWERVPLYAETDVWILEQENATLRERVLALKLGISRLHAQLHSLQGE